jgi:hypothetical protein
VTSVLRADKSLAIRYGLVGLVFKLSLDRVTRAIVKLIVSYRLRVGRAFRIIKWDYLRSVEQYYGYLKGNTVYIRKTKRYLSSFRGLASLYTVITIF